mgnify:FL=1
MNDAEKISQELMAAEITEGRFMKAKRCYVTSEGKRYPVITQKELDEFDKSA